MRMCHVPSSSSNGCAEQKQVTRFSVVPPLLEEPPKEMLVLNGMISNK